MNPLAQQIQALLFTAGEAVSVRDLSELTHATEQGVDSALTEIDTAIAESGLVLVRTNTHAQLVTSTAVAEFLAQFSSPDDSMLSKSALETLSVIAYRGPMTRADVDVLRGVDSRRMVRQLLLRGLIRHIKTSGQTAQYEVTEEFFAHIGIASKEALPNFSEFLESQS